MMLLGLSLGSISKKKRGKCNFVCWCLTLEMFLIAYPNSSNAEALSATGVDGCKFHATTLNELSDFN